MNMDPRRRRQPDGAVPADRADAAGGTTISIDNRSGAAR
jgi:hypothetical protein